MNALSSPKLTKVAWSWAEQVRTVRQLARYDTPPGTRVVLGRQGGESIAMPGRTPSLLCLHGFCGVPVEMMHAGEVARSLGLELRIPLLPGHGGHPAALRELRYADWLAAARGEFEQLRRDGPVIVVGMSMGSLLALDLALEFPEDVLGVGVIANALWLKSWFPGAALDLVDRLRIPDFGVPTKHTRHPGSRERIYNVQPVHAAISVLHAARRLRPRLGEIHCPTLVVHGARDQLCPVANAWRLAAEIGRSDTEVAILPTSDHMVPYGSETALLKRHVAHFLQRILPDIGEALGFLSERSIAAE